jgi:hypothetical protein
MLLEARKSRLLLPCLRALRAPTAAARLRPGVGGRGRRGPAAPARRRAGDRLPEPQRVVGPDRAPLPFARRVPARRLRPDAGRAAAALPVLPAHRLLRRHGRRDRRRARAGWRCYAAALLRGRRRAHALDLPAGRAAAGARAAAFRSGLARSSARCPRRPLVPVAVRYELRAEQRPELLRARRRSAPARARRPSTARWRGRRGARAGWSARCATSWRARRGPVARPVERPLPATAWRCRARLAERLLRPHGGRAARRRPRG